MRKHNKKSNKLKVICKYALLTAVLGISVTGCGLANKANDKNVNIDNATEGIEVTEVSADEISSNESVSEDNSLDEFPSEKSKDKKKKEKDKDKKADDADSEQETDEGEDVDSSENSVSEEDEGGMSQRSKILEALEKERAYYEQPDYFDKTEEMFELDKEIINNSYFDFSNKLITCIGDSIMAGQGCTVDEEGKQISFSRYLGEISGAKILENMGVPGATMGGYIGDTSVLNRVNDIPDGSDIIVVMAGFNDFINYNGMIGDETCQEGTYTHDVQAIMRTLRDRFPEKDIFVVTTYRNLYEDNPEYNTAYAFDSFLQIQRQYAKEYGIYVIDTHKWGFLDNRDQNVKDHFFADNIHLNNDGARVLAKHVLAHIIATYAEEGRVN